MMVELSLFPIFKSAKFLFAGLSIVNVRGWRELTRESPRFCSTSALFSSGAIGGRMLAAGRASESPSSVIWKHQQRRFIWCNVTLIRRLNQSSFRLETVPVYRTATMSRTAYFFVVCAACLASSSCFPSGSARRSAGWCCVVSPPPPQKGMIAGSSVKLVSEICVKLGRNLCTRIWLPEEVDWVKQCFSKVAQQIQSCLT